MKNRTLIIAIVIVVLLIAGVGGYLVFSKKTSTGTQPPSEDEQENVVIPTIIPDELGLSVQLRSDKKAVKFSIDNSSDIESVEYQISYTKEIDGEKVPEALIGEAKKDSSGKYSISYREFGTCSSGVCRYDKVSAPMTLILKITKKDGKVYQSEKPIDF